MFNNGNSGIVPVMPMGGMGYGNGMNGWGDGWWVIIVLFALFGWGGFGNGFGGNGNGNGYIDAAIQRGFDNQTVVNKLDGISNGLCSLGYDQLAQMNGINTNILTSNNALMAQLQQCCCNIENAIMQSQFAMQQGFCGVERGQMQAEYNRATDTCTITTAIKDAVTAITQNADCNYRSLRDQQVQAQMDALKAQNAELARQLEKCDDQNMINAQTQFLTNYLRPQPNPAFVVPAPWFAGSFAYGQNGNCGSCCNGNGFGF